ncbi:IclR family transcriptional regulator [Stakelama tenebrarum]|uniref:IclR family transcriptional regulator n=1 Tax=Stakelama tenebrarum TaxID=2711215 RepID=A0A6G6Y7E8_9SPHN|nr:IclR family transcriptional regulator [Sphingosinithalassobacter tenebrarum]QIG80840.1 IclR family transcriptional regulator [Sphingosinithalassobacter tenebrarum]
MPDRQLATGTARSKAPAITRAAAILRLLGKSDTPLGVQAIARELGLVPSTALYVLRALAEEELVAFDADTKRYSLGAGTLTLARQWLRRSQFADLAQPVLDGIARDFGVTALGVEIVGLDHMVVVGIAQGGGNFQLSAQIGSRFPALISATGRITAAWGDYSDAELERRFAALRWDEPPAFEHWMEQVRETRTRGYAVDDGNYIAGVTVVSAPVWKGPGKPSQALIATGISSAVQRRGLEPLAAALMDGARMVSQQLGG